MANHEITQRSKIIIYFLSLIFMPMGFLVGIYFITHKDTQYHQIGERIIEIIGIVIATFVTLFLLIMILIWFGFPI